MARICHGVPAERCCDTSRGLQQSVPETPQDSLCLLTTVAVASVPCLSADRIEAALASTAVRVFSVCANALLATKVSYAMPLWQR